MEFRESCQFICLLFIMGNRKISADLKECTLRLWELCFDLGFISESLCISKASIYRWRSVFAEFSSINQPPSPLLGRPRIIVCAVLTAIKEVYHNEADAYLDELVWWLAIHHDIVISHSALHKNLLDAGLTQKLLHKIAKERDEEMRAEYMDVIRDCTGGWGAELVFINEFSKNDHDTARCYGQAPSGQRADFIDNFVHGDRYSTVVAISISGYDAVHSVLGSFDSDQFRDFIVEQVVHQNSHSFSI